jgi:hypothetical protein
VVTGSDVVDAETAVIVGPASVLFGEFAEVTSGTVVAGVTGPSGVAAATTRREGFAALSLSSVGSMSRSRPTPITVPITKAAIVSAGDTPRRFGRGR